MPIDEDTIYTEVLRTLRELGDGFRALQAEFLAHRAGVDATIAAMRKDFHATTQSIQIDASQHRDEHTAERLERAADSEQRTQRQGLVDVQFQTIQAGQDSIQRWQWLRLVVEGVIAGLILIGLVICVMLWLFGKIVIA